MTWFYRGILWISLIIFLPIVIGRYDVSYQTVKHSYESIHQKDWDAPLMSPDIAQFNSLLKSHWKVSPVFSTLEDIFYPVRQWVGNPAQAIQFKGDNQLLKSQIKSMIRNEKATKVRAMRAYFFSKRKNFKDQALNYDFINKKNQWLATFNNVIERKVQLINGDYNNLPILMIGTACFFGALAYFSGIQSAFFVTLVLLFTLIFSSYYKIAQYAIPFHWFLILGGLMFGNHLRYTGRYPLQPSTIAFILLVVASSSPLGFLIGCCAMQLIMSYPSIRQPAYWLFLFHPLGAWYVLSKDLGRKKNMIIFGISITALIGLNATGIHLLLTTPIAYLGDVGIVINSVILMMISGCMLSEISVPKSRKIGLVFGMTLIVVIKLYLNIPLYDWVFNFIWNPIILWVSVIGLCVTLIQLMHSQSRIQAIENKGK